MKRLGGHHPRRERRDLAKREFVEGPGSPSIALLAAKHGNAKNALHAISAAEGWVRLRAEHRRRLEQARIAALMERAAEAAAQFDAQSVEVARAALGRCARFLVEEGAAGRALKPSDLLDLARTVLALQQVVHAAAGTPDERAAKERQAEDEGRGSAITPDQLAEHARKIDLRMLQEHVAAMDREAERGGNNPH